MRRDPVSVMRLMRVLEFGRVLFGKGWIRGQLRVAR